VIIRVLETQSTRGSHVVAYVTGKTDRNELNQSATSLATEYGITRPKTMTIHLNAAQRSNDEQHLVVITQDDR
jgi:hypothetical protein